MKRKNQSVARKMYSDRAARSVSYFMFTIGGLISLFYSSPVVEPVTSAPVAMLWAGLLAFGAGLCFASIVADNWVFEYVGLPLLSAGFVVYAITAFFSVTEDFPFYMTSGCFNIAVAAYLLSRFWVLRNKIYDSNVETTDRGIRARRELR